VKDKALNFGKDQSTTASIASTGFGLSAMVVGAERGWIPKGAAHAYAEKTLRFFRDRMETEHGFFYHFVDWESGKKHKNTELSSIDTALFLAGALTVGEYFKGTEVEELANEIYERVDFPWMTNGGKTLSMGWYPAEGFLKARWSEYNESLILYALAAGSATHPIPGESWKAVRKRIGLYDSQAVVYSPPLFTHQYSHVWLDLKGRNDGFVDYFENSKTATLLNRQFTIEQKKKFKTYSEDVWGLTASMGPGGYRAYGAEPGGATHDGTVAPTAAGSSMPFTPELSIPALRAMYEQHKDKLWGKYGFSDAFNLDRNWYAKEVLGIDQGPLLLMIENYRSGLVWKFFMQHPAARRGLERMGFRPGTLPLKVPPKPLIEIRKQGRAPALLLLTPEKHHELGEVAGPKDLGGEFLFNWDKRYLYVKAHIRDESLVAVLADSKMWRDDCVELFIDLQKNGFRWGSEKDLQLGMGPGAEDTGRAVWFQGVNPKKGAFDFQFKKTREGYNLEARIPWEILKINPEKDVRFGFNVAVHDSDADGTDGKLSWFFIPEGKTGQHQIGEAILRE